MKKFLFAIFVTLMMTGCAAETVMTAGTVAEGKKQEAENAAQQKQKIVDGMEEARKKAEERKKALEEI